MALEKSTKQSYEKYFVHGNFEDVMDEGETISSAVISAIDNSNSDATSIVIESGTDYSDVHKHYVRLQDGAEANSPYKFTIKIITSSGNKWEVDGLLIIKEL